jgi:hypothetical protein
MKNARMRSMSDGDLRKPSAGAAKGASLAGRWARLRDEVATRRYDAMVSRSPDRVVLTKTIIPALGRTGTLASGTDVLWIGCRGYTKTYYRLLERWGAWCWTLDGDPTVARWGRRDRHIVGNMLELDRLFPELRFDAVLCNGVFGFGVDTPADQTRAFAAMAGVAKPAGWLLLGWNSDRVPDPLEAKLASRWFQTAALPGFGTRQVVPGCTHVYDVFRRRPDIEKGPAAAS